MEISMEISNEKELVATVGYKDKFIQKKLLEYFDDKKIEYQTKVTNNGYENESQLRYYISPKEGFIEIISGIKDLKNKYTGITLYHEQELREVELLISKKNSCHKEIEEIETNIINKKEEELER